MILLDTHTLIWTIADDTRLGVRARRRIQRAGVRYVSSVTHAEIAIKVARNKLRVPPDLVDLVAGSGFDPLALEVRHSEGIARFPGLARHDPFDRLLVAQAAVDGLTFLTADQTLLALGQSWIVDATL